MCRIDRMTNPLKLLEFIGFVYMLVLILVRAAIAAFFLRLLPDYGYRWQRWVIIASFWIYASFTLSYGFAVLFACGDPLDVANPDPTCISLGAQNALALASPILTSIMDWLLTILPAFIIFRGLMSTRDKFSVIFMMLLGGIGSIISIVRIPFLDLGIMGGADQFGNLSVYLVLQVWENAVGILAISLAALKPLIKELFPHELSQSPSNVRLFTAPTFVELSHIPKDEAC